MLKFRLYCVFLFTLLLSINCYRSYADGINEVASENFSILNTPATIAAIITGCIALINIMVQISTFLIKQKNDSKVNFELVLKEKIQKIYTPLIIEFNSPKVNLPLIDTKIIDLVLNYGFLLSKELLECISELINIEKEYIKVSSNEEYNLLRIKAIELTNIEFSQLL